MATKYIVNNVSGQTINGQQLQPYKVYTALLTQNGSSSYTTVSDQPIVIGTTYQITFNNGSGDFLNVGAPNNEIGTYFVATGTTPTAWGGAELEYNTASPTVKVLENTIGYIWYEFLNNGVYSAKIDGGWDSNKSWYGIPGVGNSGTININPGNTKISFENSDLLIVTYNNDYSETVNQQLVNTPIEIRVYN
jgi:hypothetical protein